MISRSAYVAWILAAVVAALAGYWLARQLDSPDIELRAGTWLPQPRPISDFTLTDQAGQPFMPEHLRGRPTLVFFGFTHCPDVCPTTLTKLAQIRKAAQVENLRILLVSVDPERDTPQALATYVRAFDTELTGVTGAPEAIQRLTEQFGVAVERVELPGGGYTVDHSATIFLLDEQARLVAVFTPPLEVEAVAEDLRRAEPHLRT